MKVLEMTSEKGEKVVVVMALMTFAFTGLAIVGVPGAEVVVYGTMGALAVWSVSLTVKDCYRWVISHVRKSN